MLPGVALLSGSRAPALSAIARVADEAQQRAGDASVWYITLASLVVPKRLEFGELRLDLLDDEAHATIGCPFLLGARWVEFWCLHTATNGNEL